MHGAERLVGHVAQQCRPTDRDARDLVIAIEAVDDRLARWCGDRRQVAIGVAVAHRLGDGSNGLTFAGDSAQAVVGPGQGVIAICRAGQPALAVGTRVVVVFTFDPGTARFSLQARVRIGQNS
jgi:hypothetical protein